MTPTLIAFTSEKYNDIIPFSRVIATGQCGKSMSVYLEDKHMITIMPDEIKTFKEQYTLYLSLVQALEMGIELEKAPEPKIMKRKKDE